MEQVIKEKDGTRMFERVSRWNVIDYTIVSPKNRLAKYADNYSTDAARLNLTIFKFGGHTYSLNQFAKLVEPIQLEDRTILSRQSIEDPEYYLEVNNDKDKVRLYKLIK